MITLTPEQHARWVAAVAEWPTCQWCRADLPEHEESPHYSVDRGDCFCPHCVAGRVPQPVVLVIEGEPAKHVHDRYCAGLDCIQVPEFVVPVGWRVPAGEPVELRATCSECEGRAATEDLECYYCDSFNPGSVLVARATVELLPVYAWNDQQKPFTHPFVETAPDGFTQRWFRNDRWRPHDPTSSEWVHRGIDGNEWTRTATLDPLPVPGRHWVAICTPGAS